MEYTPKIGVIGLGYVGLPLAIHLSKHFEVVGFDNNQRRIEELNKNFDSTNEITRDELEYSRFIRTADEASLKDPTFYIIAVPTPTTKANNLDLSYLESATRLVGKSISKGSIVVYESTVYPGATEEICVPILEHESGLKCGVDFKVGFSPERINPGDRDRTVDKIVKVISGMDDECLEKISFVYSKIIKAGVHKVRSIKVAEAAKVVENVQRDVNIALVNELSIIFEKLGIDIKEVIDAASTKWNFHKYQPGLVGGHCIGVDPYYLIHKSEEVGYSPLLIRSARMINDAMHKEVVKLILKGSNKAGKSLKGSKVLICGLTFKENVNDIRNTRVKKIIEELKAYDCDVVGCDPNLSKEVIAKEFEIKPLKLAEIKDVDILVLAVAHTQFKLLTLRDFKSWMRDKPVLIDVKRMFDKSLCEKEGFIYLGL